MKKISKKDEHCSGKTTPCHQNANHIELSQKKLGPSWSDDIRMPQDISGQDST
jgi:hypothetical protein